MIARKSASMPVLCAGALLVTAAVLAVGSWWEPDASRDAPALAATAADAVEEHVATTPVGGPLLPLPTDVEVDPVRRTLGERLFHDTGLSADGTVSCATCHDLARGGVDGLRVSRGVGGREGELNAPTVLNAAFNFRQFWDGRAPTLEDQVDGPLLHADELGSGWDAALAHVRADPVYRELFADAYDGRIVRETICNAIATFERSLVTPGARFDRFLLGEADALDARELRGHELFLELGCTTCHQGVNIGGNMFQVFGRIRPFYEDDAEVAPADRGRFNVTGREEDLHKFKVPSLRNVALTAPYLHDGSVETLGETVQLMARHELGFDLTDPEVDALVAFLHTLTGEQPASP